MGFDIWEHGQIGVFGFVLAIVLIGSLFQYLKIRSNNETIRQLAASGQTIDPALLRHLGREEQDVGTGLIVGGVIMMGVAAGLYFFGAQLGAATGDPEVGPVFRAIAGLVGFIGGALLLVGVPITILRRRDDRQG